MLGLKEIRLALLEADVALSVAKEFIEKIRPKAIGQEILKSISPGQMIIKIVYDELVNFLGEKNQELNLNTAASSLHSFSRFTRIRKNN